MLKKDLEFEMTSMMVMIKPGLPKKKKKQIKMIKPKDFSRTPYILPTIVMTHQVQLGTTKKTSYMQISKYLKSCITSSLHNRNK